MKWNIPCLPAIIIIMYKLECFSTYNKNPIDPRLSFRNDMYLDTLGEKPYNGSNYMDIDKTCINWCDEKHLHTVDLVILARF